MCIIQVEWDPQSRMVSSPVPLKHFNGTTGLLIVLYSGLVGTFVIIQQTNSQHFRQVSN